MPTKYLAPAVVVLLIAVWHTVGHHQSDEHFQILEFAAYKLGTIAGSDLQWEFHEQMRPALQPAMVYVFHKLAGAFGTVNPFWMATFTRLLSAALFLTVTLKVYRQTVPNLAEKYHKWLAILLLFAFCNVYVGVRFNSENWSGAFFALGLLTYPISGIRQKWARPRVLSNAGWSSALLAGVYFGLSFEFRYQTALAAVGFGLWLLVVTRPNWRHFTLLILGGLVTVGLCTLIDFWFYGDYVFAPWNYLAQNLIEGKAATYGSEPVWFYLYGILRSGIPPISLVMLAAIGYFCYRYRWSPLTWSFVVFFVVHSLISRKDVRFLFPLLPFLPVVIMVLYRDLEAYFASFGRTGRGVRRFLAFCFGLNVLVLTVIIFRPLKTNNLLMRHIFNNYEGPVSVYSYGYHVYDYGDLVYRYYKPTAGATTVQMAEGETYPGVCPSNACFFSTKSNNPQPPPGAKLVYTTRPGIIDYFDPFGALSKVRFWWLYELE